MKILAARRNLSTSNDGSAGPLERRVDVVAGASASLSEPLFGNCDLCHRWTLQNQTKTCDIRYLRFSAFFKKFEFFEKLNFGLFLAPGVVGIGFSISNSLLNICLNSYLINIKKSRI